MAKRNYAKIFVPAERADVWQRLLAEPEKHWKRGYSARTLAYCWHDGDGFPKSVKEVLENSDTFRDIELCLAIPEHQVPLPPYESAPSQSDLWVLARCSTGLVSIAVEGKVAEPFGPTISEWIANVTPGKKERLDFLSALLDRDFSKHTGIRYQLLHRTGSAVLEARRYFARHAMLMVHSFSKTNQWFGDYEHFVGLFGVDGICNKVLNVGEVGGIQLHFVWVRGEKRYLDT
jgi:hypothetical protein